MFFFIYRTPPYPNAHFYGGLRYAQAVQEEEKSLVARVVHLMRNDDTDRYFRMLVVARRHLGQVRMPHWSLFVPVGCVVVVGVGARGEIVSMGCFVSMRCRIHRLNPPHLG